MNSWPWTVKHFFFSVFLFTHHWWTISSLWIIFCMRCPPWWGKKNEKRSEALRWPAHSWTIISSYLLLFIFIWFRNYVRPAYARQRSHFFEFTTKITYKRLRDKELILGGGLTKKWWNAVRVNAYSFYIYFLVIQAWLNIFLISFLSDASGLEQENI